jgi:hypothetical protein
MAMRRAAAPLVLAGLATLAVAFLAPLAPFASGSAPVLLLGYVASLAACAAWWLLRGSAAPGAAAADVMSGLARPAQPEPAPVPARLRELERLVAAALESALDAEARLRPELRELACALLWARRRVEVDPGAGEVAARVGMPGEPLLGLRSALRPEITAPGASALEVGRVLDRLEII